MVVLVVCIIVCVTQDCGSTVVALDGVVVVWWWCGYLTDYNTTLKLHRVTLGCGNKHFAPAPWFSTLPHQQEL